MPHRLVADRDRDAARAELLQAAQASLDSVLAEPIADCVYEAPDGSPCIEAKTTADLESSLGMVGGDIFHGALSWPWAEDDEALPTAAARWGVSTEHERVLLCGVGRAARRGRVSARRSQRGDGRAGDARALRAGRSLRGAAAAAAEAGSPRIPERGAARASRSAAAAADGSSMRLPGAGVVRCQPGMRDGRERPGRRDRLRHRRRIPRVVGVPVGRSVRHDGKRSHAVDVRRPRLEAGTACATARAGLGANRALMSGISAVPTAPRIAKATTARQYGSL